MLKYNESESHLTFFFAPLFSPPLGTLDLSQKDTGSRRPGPWQPTTLSRPCRQRPHPKSTPTPLAAPLHTSGLSARMSTASTRQELQRRPQRYDARRFRRAVISRGRCLSSRCNALHTWAAQRVMSAHCLLGVGLRPQRSVESQHHRRLSTRQPQQRHWEGSSRRRAWMSRLGKRWSRTAVGLVCLRKNTRRRLSGAV